MDMRQVIGNISLICKYEETINSKTENKRKA